MADLKDSESVIIDFNQPAIQEAERRLTMIITDCQECLAELEWARSRMLGDGDQERTAQLIANLFALTGVKRIEARRAPAVQ